MCPGPIDRRILTEMIKYCQEFAGIEISISVQKLTQFFFGASAFQALYYLEVRAYSGTLGYLLCICYRCVMRY